MKKSLMSLLLVGSLLAPSALVLAEEPGAEEGVPTTSIENELESQPTPEVEQRPESWDDERLTITPLENTSAIAYETKRVPNANMFEDEDEVVVTPGVDGVLTTITQIAQWKGNAASWLPGGGVREIPEITTEPITQVVEYGTAVRGQEKDTTRIDIPFETKVVENDELPVGTEEVSQEGVNGWYELTTIYETKDGKRTEKVLEEEKETDRKEPVNKIIQKGTKEVADEFVVTATLVDEEGNALTGEVLTITGEDVEQELTTDENGAVTFSVPNGTYTVAFGINSKTVVVEDEDISVELVAGPKEVTPDPEFYIGVVRNDFPQFDAEDNEYEVVIGEEVTTITITDKDGKLVAVIEYNEDTDTTKIKSIPATPIQPGVNTKVIVDGVKEKFPTFDNEDYTYETEVTETKVIVTIKNKEGHLVAVVEYDREKEAYSVKPAELTPAKPIEKDEETTVEDDESGVVVDEEDSEVVAGQSIQVKRTDSVDSRANLPETGELGSGLTIMAALLAGLGGLGLLFKRRS